MASPLCLRCLRRSLRSIDDQTFVQRAAFSSTSSLFAKPAPPKRAAAVKPGSRAQKTLRLTKKTRSSSGRPPASGERKAVRKRIVLSNTNALEVKGLQDLTADKLMRHEAGSVTLHGFHGLVLGFNNETVNALRALEAFRPTQGWSLFRRPASLMRKETAELANDFASVEGEGKETIRKVVFGEKGSGKSVLLLQAQAMALVKDWVVIHFPEGQDLVNAQTAYQPLNTPDGTVYVQPRYTAKLLANIAAANQSLLSTMQLSKQHQLPIPIQPNMSLARFAELGARDPSLAWPIWQALWEELTVPSNGDGKTGLERPPMLVSMDGVDQAMRMSAYLDADAKPIHAHDLALVKHFTSLLAGQTSLSNGGAVLAATCESNRASSPTLDYALQHAYTARRNSTLTNEQAEPARNASKPLPLPEWQPYTIKDLRVEAAMQGVKVIKLQGLSKDEAKGVMDYYAQSGVLRSAVTDSLVGERWTLAGSGIIGELEKGAVRVRF